MAWGTAVDQPFLPAHNPVDILKPTMFSKRISTPGSDNRLSLRRAELQRTGVELLNLAESNPSRCGLVPKEALDFLRKDEALRYNPDCRGLPSARGALSRLTGTSTNDIFLCASTSEAYSWLFKLLCNPGDTVLVPKPGYPLFDYLAGLEAVRVESYRLEYFHPAGWEIDLVELEESFARLKPRALVLINPNNPTGSFVRGREREAIERLALRHDCALIVDEVFMPFPVEAEGSPESFRTSAEGLVFCLNGLSKMLCLPQMKLGWIELAGNSELRAQAAKRLEVIADSYLSAGVVPMLALPELLDLSAKVAARVRSRLTQNLTLLRSTFEGPESPYRVLRCDGGWTALLEVPRYLPEEELCLHLLENAHLVLFPGYFFDCERDGLLSVSLILEEEAFAEGISRLKSALDALGSS